MSWRRTEIYRDNVKDRGRAWGVIFENPERGIVASVLGFIERKDAVAFVLVDAPSGALTAKLEKRADAPKPQQEQSGLDAQAEPAPGPLAQSSAIEETS